MEDPLLGMIQLFGFGFAPYGWVLCNGSTLPISTNQPLYSLLGITFGGDGRNTFGIPDLRNAVPIKQPQQMGYYIATQGLYPSRNDY